MCFKLRHSGSNKITPGSQYSRLIEVVLNNPITKIKIQLLGQSVNFTWSAATLVITTAQSYEETI